MHVTNRAKWTRAKKKTIVVLYTVGIALGFTIEKASIWWGVFGIFLCILGALLMSTVRRYEW